MAPVTRAHVVIDSKCQTPPTRLLPMHRTRPLLTLDPLAGAGHSPIPPIESKLPRWDATDHPALRIPLYHARGRGSVRAELHALWKVERPEVTKAVSAAAANGDRSENGDYIYGKKRLREIDSRVRFLRKRLDSLTVVSEPLGEEIKSGLVLG